MILLAGARLAIIGIACGLLLASWMARLVATQLFAVKALDPITFAGGAVILFLVTMLATFVPARRATRLDPVTTLRYE